MEITIKRNIAEALDCNKIKLKLLSKPVKPAIVCLLLGIGLILLCQNDLGVTQTSLYCYIFFEMMLFMISFVFLKAAYLRQKTYKDFSKTALQKYSPTEAFSITTIDDDYFIYESKTKYYKLSWPALYMYQLYNGSLVLMIDSYNNSFIIKPHEVSPEEFKELYDFVSKRLKLRKR